MIGRNEEMVEGNGEMLGLYKNLERVLPQGAQLLWNDWHDGPAVMVSDINRDGKEELLVTYAWDGEIYTSIFAHDYSYWYIVTTTRGDQLFRVKGIDLFPASVKGIGNEKWGFINHEGKFVTPIKYEDANDFQENGLASVKLNGKYGLINRFGQFIVTPKYESISTFSEGRAVVINTGGFKVINQWGKELTNKAYSFIGNYQNGRAMFADTTEDGSYLYGFLNKQGKEIIPLKYEMATNFSKSGKAVVKNPTGPFELINQNGKVLQTYHYANVGELSEGLMAYQPENGGKFGYMNESGETVIQPAFTGAQSFKGSRAIVNMGEEYGFQYGLIDKTGKFVFEPIYNDISILGEGRVALGKAIVKDRPYEGSKYAIATVEGQILTDFKLYNVLNYDQGYASANDGTNTFFIDKKGQIAKQLPIAKGTGTLTFEGALIKGMIDMRLRYYNLKGNLVWSQNQIISLNERFRVVERKFSPNKDYLVYYPEIQGMRYEAMQKKVNAKLAQLAGVKEVNPNVQLESSYTGDYEVYFFKNHLVVIEISGYDYPFGAAHGMPIKVYAHVDLESGAFYELKDLFKEGSPYVKEISDIIGEQIKNDPQYSYVFPDSYKGIAPDQPFYVDENHLFIYFAPYEIGPYAAGFPTFTIPFNEIDHLINKAGNFWRSFH
jgi:hypothetical protein